MHTRVYVDDRGVTRFAPFEPTDTAGSRRHDADHDAVRFPRPPGAVQEWHNALVPMLVITLRGRMEVEIAGGQTQEFGPGDVRLAEDTTGTGHRTRVLGDEPWHFAVLMLEPPPAGT